MSLLDKLNWRYATKRMNEQILSSEKVDNILEAIRLAPSSMGLQPFHCFVISDKELLAKINSDACKQPQIIEGSHLIVFSAWKGISEEQVNDYISNIAQTRGVGTESLEGFKGMIMGSIAQPADKLFNWNARQAYIALGFGLVAAAHEGVDATPMEGFDNAAMDKVLGLESQQLGSVCLLMLGHRNEETDYLVHAKKVRRSSENLFTKL